MEEKNCELCGFYVQHYVKRHNKFRKVSGYCINKKPRIKELKPCELWKPDENTEERQKQSICDALRDMAKQIDDIAIILKNEDY